MTLPYGTRWSGWTVSVVTVNLQSDSVSCASRSTPPRTMTFVLNTIGGGVVTTGSMCFGFAWSRGTQASANTHAANATRLDSTRDSRPLANLTLRLSVRCSRDAAAAEDGCGSFASGLFRRTE